MHALHDHARNFYIRFNFEPSPTDPLHLMLLIKDAKASAPALQADGEDDCHRRELIDELVKTGADRAPLESLTHEQLFRLMAVMALTNADQLRELFPDGADAVLAAAVLANAREATGFTDKALRRVTLAGGSALLIDADCGDTDDEIRESDLAAKENEDGEQMQPS